MLDELSAASHDDGETLRILLVEDNAHDRRLIRTMLETGMTAGCKIAECGDVASAERAVLSDPAFDVVLLDLSLPDSGGIETLDRVRDAASGLPIVILTGVEDDAVIEIAALEGVSDYLLKTEVTEGLLRRVIYYAIQRRRAEIDLETARAEAEAANETKTRFLADISHRMRTPLNTIIGLSELIQSGAVGGIENPRINGYIGDIDSSGRTLYQIVNEILEVEQAEAALKSKDGTYRQLVDMSPDCICVLKDGRIKLINSAGAAMFGMFRDDDLLERDIHDLVQADYHPLFDDGCKALAAEQRPVPMRFIHPRRLVDVMVSVRPFIKGDGSLLLVARDISEVIDGQRKIERQAQRLTSILDTAVDAIVVTDARGVIETFNGAAEKMFGYAKEEVVGRSIDMLMPVDVRENHHKMMLDFGKHLRRRVLGIGREISGARRDGSVFPIEISLSEVRQDTGTLYTAVIRDITERKELEERLTHHATHDDLTGLANRNLLNDRLGRATSMAARHGTKLAVLFIDLDGFKTINDSLGHEAGDELLREVSRRLKETIRESDTAARFGGDEFVVVLPEVEDFYGVLELAERFLTILKMPIRAGGREVVISASIGISAFPKDGKTGSDLIRHADVAMLQAKMTGRNTIRFYDDSMHEDAIERLNLENALRKALEDETLFLAYQPQIDLKTGRVVGVEALARWRHEKIGMVPPSKFIPLAEETGLIIPLGNFVIERACKEIVGLHRTRFPDLRVAINISPRQFGRINITNLVRRMIDLSGIDPRSIDLEITESTLMRDPELVVNTLQELKEIGVHLSIDDFGTGYSSLAYLKRFPVDTIKVDKAFVDGIADNVNDRSIVSSIVSLAHSLNMKALAEGVEVFEQKLHLEAMGCDEVQGFMLSRPLEFDDLVTFLETWQVKAG